MSFKISQERREAIAADLRAHPELCYRVIGERHGCCEASVKIVKREFGIKRGQGGPGVKRRSYTTQRLQETRERRAREAVDKALRKSVREARKNLWREFIAVHQELTYKEIAVALETTTDAIAIFCAREGLQHGHTPVNPILKAKRGGRT
jgi:IS30 family transposase